MTTKPNWLLVPGILLCLLTFFLAEPIAKVVAPEYAREAFVPDPYSSAAMSDAFSKQHEVLQDMGKRWADQKREAVVEDIRSVSLALLVFFGCAALYLNRPAQVARSIDGDARPGGRQESVVLKTAEFAGEAFGKGERTAKSLLSAFAAGREKQKPPGH